MLNPPCVDFYLYKNVKFYLNDVKIVMVICLKIGNVLLDGKVICAPMAGITNRVYRKIAKEYRIGYSCIWWCVDIQDCAYGCKLSELSGGQKSKIAFELDAELKMKRAIKEKNNM